MWAKIVNCLHYVVKNNDIIKLIYILVFNDNYWRKYCFDWEICNNIKENAEDFIDNENFFGFFYKKRYRNKYVHIEAKFYYKEEGLYSFGIEVQAMRVSVLDILINISSVMADEFNCDIYLLNDSRDELVFVFDKNILLYGSIDNDSKEVYVTNIFRYMPCGLVFFENTIAGFSKIMTKLNKNRITNLSTCRQHVNSVFDN